MRIASCVMLSVLVTASGLSCASDTGRLRKVSDPSAAVPDEVISLLARMHSGEFFLVETVVNRPPVPNLIACDWTETPPSVRFVDPSHPDTELLDESKRAVIMEPDGGQRPAPFLMARYSLWLQVDRGTRAFHVRDSELRPVAIRDVTGGAKLWIAKLCSKGDEVLVEADWTLGSYGIGKQVRVRHVEGKWQIVSVRETWVT